MTITNLEIEQALMFVQNKPQKRIPLMFPKTILVKTLRFADPYIETNYLYYPNGGNNLHGIYDKTRGWHPDNKCIVKVLLCGVESIEDLETEQDVVITDGADDRHIICYCFRYNVLILNHYYLAHKCGDYYMIDNQTCFEELL